MVISNTINLENTDYRGIFERAELTLKQHCSFSDDEFNKVYGGFKKFEIRKRADSELFKILIMIAFYSGFRSSTVEDKEEIILGHFPDYARVAGYGQEHIERILSDTNMIRNKRKIEGCIENAKTFKMMVEKHGSFNNYLSSFDPNESFEKLLLLKEELEYSFNYLGGITVYHFLMILGLTFLNLIA